MSLRTQILTMSDATLLRTALEMINVLFAYFEMGGIQASNRKRLEGTGGCGSFFCAAAGRV